MSRLPDLNRHELAVQDGILQYISSNFVSVKVSESKLYKSHLKNVVENLITKMKEVDKLFCAMFQKDCVAGSFWDGLKVGNPVEFDKNFVLSFPRSFNNHIQIINVSPSFVCLNVNEGFMNLKKSVEWEKYRKLENWMDKEGNIIPEKVRFWMESVIDKAVKSFPEVDKLFIMEIEGVNSVYKLVTRKSGPAMTIEVKVSPSNTIFHIDLVSTFEFPPCDWPVGRGHPSNIPKKSWHLVPKPLHPKEPKSILKGSRTFLQWRLSCHQSESDIVHDTLHLKAVLKLIKKLRDTKLDQRLLSSYAIKTVFMWERGDLDNSFYRQSLSTCFLHMLNVLMKKLKEGCIPFYWDKGHNLLCKLTKGQKEHLYYTIQKTWNRISEGLTGGNDRFIIAREMLTDDEYAKICNDIEIGMSNEKIVAKLRR